MSDPVPTRSIEQLAQQFLVYARDVYAGSSALYQLFSTKIAQDRDLLAIANLVPKGQPVPNLLFGIVHYLLLQGARHPLAWYYPSLSGSAPPDDDAYSLFRSFCFAERSTIQQLMEKRRVQTNEVQRCACLLPAFDWISLRSNGLPLTCIEVGASAGLNLLWDRYGYDYGENRRYGDLASPVQFRCALLGPQTPPFLADIPRVASRVGIDLTPINVRDASDALWLRALVWPEQQARAALLKRAIELAQAAPPTLLTGDALERLPGLLDQTPPDTALTVWHSFTWNQLAPQTRERFRVLLASTSRHRDIYELGLEWPRGEPNPSLDVVVFSGEKHRDYHLAICQQHGAWLEWQEGN